MQDDEFETGIWAVVAAHDFGLVVGKLELDSLDLGLYGSEQPHILLRECIKRRLPVRIYPCFSFRVDVVMTDTGGGLASQYFRQATPLTCCEDGEPLTTLITGGMLFDQMSEASKKRHKELVKQLVEQLKVRRAKNAGIVLPDPKGYRRGV